MKVWNGVLIRPRQIWLVESIESHAFNIQIILFVISTILMIAWMYWSYSNLGKFLRLKRPENMTIACWFTPFYNLIGPLLIYSELVSGYEEVLAKEKFIRRDSRRKTLRNWWWLTLMVALALFSFSFDYDRYEMFFSVFATMLFMLSNILLLSSLSDMEMMERGMGEFKHVSKLSADDAKLDDII
jgi:hypothetical protein